jgi:Signal transduction histidine kinase
MAHVNTGALHMERLTPATAPEELKANSNEPASTTGAAPNTAGDSLFHRLFLFAANECSRNARFHTFWNGKLKSGLLVLLVSVVAILAIFKVVSNGIDDMLLSEKLLEKQIEVDLVAEQVNLSLKKNRDWEREHDYYVNNIMISMEMLDRLPMTYAAVFDKNLHNLSARSPSYEGGPFEPTIYQHFAKTVLSSESGSMLLPFTPPNSPSRDMYLHFKWMPSDPSVPNRVLAVVAISKYTLSNKVSAWMQIAALSLVLAVIVCVVAFWNRHSMELANRTLEDTVKQRTAELEEQTEAAQKASMAKSDFLSNMSHEMRTPMNAIIGMTAIAKNAEEMTRKDYCLEKIEEASTHLLSVINDILDMSKIEAQKFDLSFEKFNFERVLQKVSNITIFRVNEKHQDFTVLIDKNIPLHLVGDDQRITQVVANLMSNAVKFTPEGGSIQLKAHMLEEEEDSCTVKVSVKDSGIGISPEQQARLFSSFSQAESSTTRKFGGTGLGLAISKYIVEKMNGRIWVESELGKGSTFAFTVRMQKVAGVSDSLLHQGTNWKNMNVLVVDDSAEEREYFADIMQRFGSWCDVAASGDEACETIDRHGSYNLYFVDWHMPGMDGIELARRINASGKDNLIVLMGVSSEWDAIESVAKEAGVNRFLPKPLFPSNISDCINECLGTDNVVLGSNEVSYDGLFKGRRILLAEDVEVNREIVIALLEGTNLGIDVAENGQIACTMFGKDPARYDMIFMDVQMPGMDGYEATKNIRAMGMQKAQEIPIIAMTANVFKEDVERCLECGMNGHLGKPLNYDKLVSTLCGYLFASKSKAGKEQVVRV